MQLVWVQQFHIQLLPATTYLGLAPSKDKIYDAEANPTYTKHFSW